MPSSEELSNVDGRTVIARTLAKRFSALDFMRGIAAFWVMLFHTGQALGGWIPRFGYLAVDVFFLLSGFVIAHAYDDRFRNGLSRSQFLSLRVVRLYPLYLLGLILGTTFAFCSYMIAHVSAANLAISFMPNIIGLPSPALDHFQAPTYDMVFPLNVVFWSLFFEFWVANLAYAILFKYLDWKGLGFIVGLSAIGLVAAEKIHYTASVGHSWSDFAFGVPRVMFSFFAGVALLRLYQARKMKLEPPAWLSTLILPAILSLPLEGALAHRYELGCIFILFPALVYFAAHAVGRHFYLGNIMGDASYALYTIHCPLMVLVGYSLSYDKSWLSQILFSIVVLPLAWLASLSDLHARSAFKDWQTRRTSPTARD